MAKKKKEFEKMWKDSKKYLKQASKDTLVLLKKGEKQVAELSGKGKLNFEVMLLKAKKEQIYYSLGKGAVSFLNNKPQVPAKLKKFLRQLSSIDDQIKKNQRMLK